MQTLIKIVYCFQSIVSIAQNKNVFPWNKENSEAIDVAISINTPFDCKNCLHIKTSLQNHAVNLFPRGNLSTVFTIQAVVAQKSKQDNN